MKSKLIIIVALLTSYYVSAQPSGYLGKKTILYAEAGIAPAFSNRNILLDNENNSIIAKNYSLAIQRTITNQFTIGFKYSNQVYKSDLYFHLAQSDYAQYYKNPTDELTDKELRENSYAIAYSDPSYYVMSKVHHLRFIVSKSNKYIAPIGRYISAEIGYSFGNIELMNITRKEPINYGDSIRTVGGPTLGFSYYIQKPLFNFLIIKYGFNLNLQINRFYRHLFDPNLKYYNNSEKDWNVFQDSINENIILDSFFKFSVGLGILAF